MLSPELPQGDNLGSHGIVVLANNNYVISSPFDDENGIFEAGSVRLMDGETGQKIGTAMVGDVANDFFGSTSITAIGNGNYVIASSSDTENGIVDSGSVRLVDGESGQQIGPTMTGDTESDILGSDGIIALANNNYLINSPMVDASGQSNTGSVSLMDGNTGLQIGMPLSGDLAGDFMGLDGIIALGNINYVVVSLLDDENGIVNAGSVRLMDGETGQQIGTPLVGDAINDDVGDGGITALGNNNYVVASVLDDENGLINTGSVRLMNGDTGLQIGTALIGDNDNDFLGGGLITALENNNYVVASISETVNGVAEAGSVRLMDGMTGLQIRSIVTNSNYGDLYKVRVVKPVHGNYFILGLELFDKGGLTDSGKVQIVVP